ncbi:TlpA family protein disulfide reductase [Pedobacter insulae]|uniref:Peroxiredoxin n=1 Tax=Pedobacter insulae TaxID=414048 RepID=A0A1I2VFC2_9SPHI|nr:TlpA disulfide reductase family protein [Pedobacter insulae]SFG87870.1 Peroxiredoxin [Pedobacter insulae]
MKQKLTYITVLFLTLLSSFNIYGQGTSKQKALKETTVTIELLYPTKEQVTLTVSPIFKSKLNNEQQVFTFKPDNGKIKLSVLLDQVSSLDISVGGDLFPTLRRGLINRAIWLEPEDDLTISIPSSKSNIDNGFIFKGKGSSKSTFIRKYGEFQERAIAPFKVSNPTLDQYGRFKSYTDQFDRTEYDLRLLRAIDSLEKVFQGKVSERFVKAFKAHCIGFIHYVPFGSGKQPLEDPKYVKQIRKLEQSFPAEKMASYLINFNSWDSFFINRALVSYSLDRGLNDNYILWKDFNLVPSIISNYYKTSNFANQLVYGYFRNLIGMKGISDSLVSSANKFIAERDQNDDNVKELQSLISSAAINQKTGAKAFPFSLKNEKKQTVNLSDFKGKVVLLDFMFFGCGGCAMMVPAMEEVEKNFEGKDVVFISISIDPAFEKFKEGIGKFNSKGGVHLYTNGKGYNHELIKHYAITGYPTLVLIDREGNLVNANAPRADAHQKELIAMIDKALAQ